MRGKLVALLIGALAMACLCSTPSDAQMPTVTPTGVTTLSACPANVGFYSDQNNHPTCYTGTLGCPNTAPITPTWSITNPGGTLGTIVFFGGGGGEDAASFPGEEQIFVPLYTAAGYQVVQVIWPSDWELVNTPNTSYTPNILNAACRISSVLQYVYNNNYTTGGMCAQGASAGGGGLAYALAWYGAWKYLDKAVFASSPVFSDIEQGCEVPNSTSVSMCSSGSQLGCNGWTSNPLPYETAEFTDHAVKVEEWTGGTNWTGPATCANNTPPLQTTTYNTQWYNQSIVNFPPAGQQQPQFTYKNTAMTAWLCEGDDQEGGFNNSGSQGMLYFQQFTNTNEYNWLEVDGVTGCLDTEGVSAGTPPPSWVTLLQNNHLQPTGANAIAFDMSSPAYAQSCHKLHSGS